MPNTWNNSGERLVHETDTQGIDSAPQNATQAYAEQSRMTGEDSERRGASGLRAGTLGTYDGMSLGDLLRDITDGPITGSALSLSQLAAQIDAEQARMAGLRAQHFAPYHPQDPNTWSREAYYGAPADAPIARPASLAPDEINERIRNAKGAMFDHLQSILCGLLSTVRYRAASGMYKSPQAAVEDIAMLIATDLAEYQPDKFDPATFLENSGY